MSIIEEALVAKLKATTAVTDLVAARIFPVIMPLDPTFPGMTYAKVFPGRQYSQSGPSGLARGRFQFTCWGATYASAKNVANAVISTLDGLSDTLSGVRVDSITNASEIDGYDREAKSYYVAVDFYVWHNE